MRIALKLCYNGARFYGYARQPRLPTVEGSLILALKKEEVMFNLSRSYFRSASRTDRGVSSLGNVVAFNILDGKTIDQDSLNRHMNDIWCYGSTVVKNDFYPRFARQRIYQYFLPDDGRYDMQSITATLSLFTGINDFSNFSRIEDGKNPLRCLDSIDVSKEDGFIVLKFSAQTYLWKQIRRIVSEAISVEEGTRTHNDIVQALVHPDVYTHMHIAPAFPLILSDVCYDDVEFIRHKMAGYWHEEIIKTVKKQVRESFP